MVIYGLRRITIHKVINFVPVFMPLIKSNHYWNTYWQDNYEPFSTLEWFIYLPHDQCILQNQNSQINKLWQGAIVVCVNCSWFAHIYTFSLHLTLIYKTNHFFKKHFPLTATMLITFESIFLSLFFFHFPFTAGVKIGLDHQSCSVIFVKWVIMFWL